MVMSRKNVKKNTEQNAAVHLSGYGPVIFGNRPVRTRMPGGVRGAP